MGYGFPVFDGRGVATPRLGVTRSGEGATVRLGQSLKLGPSREWTLESEFADGSRSVRAGYSYRPSDSLDLTVEASRRETARDDAPEHAIMLRLRIHW